MASYLSINAHIYVFHILWTSKTWKVEQNQVPLYLIARLLTTYIQSEWLVPSLYFQHGCILGCDSSVHPLWNFSKTSPLSPQWLSLLWGHNTPKMRYLSPVNLLVIIPNKFISSSSASYIFIWLHPHLMYARSVAIASASHWIRIVMSGLRCAYHIGP